MKSNKHTKTVAVAMSGGVDSSVAAALLKKEGYNVIGLTMKHLGYEDVPGSGFGCCSIETILNAKNIAEYIGFKHYIIDLKKEFRETVISDFVTEYLRGNTPNPCIQCNKIIKWDILLKKAVELGAEFITTGHYAKIKYNNSTNRYNIAVGKDKEKDQSYALWCISQEALSKTILPMGDYTKNEVRKIASEMKLPSADTPDSQEICFVPDDYYAGFLETLKPELKQKDMTGNIIYKGNIIGKHKGFYKYTIGQRRGLNVSAGKPLYVIMIDADNNIVYVDDEEGLYRKEFKVIDINLMTVEKLTNTIEVYIKIRYKDTGSPALISQTGEKEITAEFLNPKKSVTPGQSAVFYIGEDVLGGGIITVNK
ncbi:MAG: tRNA 2-thiouridine(34) synthase MnmA [Ignavibacteria bacterium]|nr:tRNA 2-thiouridine(34) synthase MnmA [Ignavibacteria bacterium]